MSHTLIPILHDSPLSAHTPFVSIQTELAIAADDYGGPWLAGRPSLLVLRRGASRCMVLRCCVLHPLHLPAAGYRDEVRTGHARRRLPEW